jgi:glucoamylase
MSPESNSAPGHPGISPRWTSSAKSGVGTSLSSESRVWFTLSHGILNEVYYPRLDQACIRDMELLVSDGKDFFSEEKRQAQSQVETLADGVPAFQLTNTCNEGRYRIHKTVLTDPRRDVLLQRIRFESLQGNLGDYHLYVLLAPHLGNHGVGNTAWVQDYKGLPVLDAQRDETALSLACSVPWLKRSVGFVGVSDGWQDVFQHKQMLWEYEHADDGNLALTAEIDLAACNGEFTLALGFGLTPAEASLRARASLEDGFDTARDAYVQEWQDWQKGLGSPPILMNMPSLYRTSAAVLRTHEAKRFPGGMIASLSIPWGFDKGDEDMGGYHLVWSRDLVETAGGLLAIGAHEEVRRVLYYLQGTQEADGHWPQNMWMDGSPYWGGIQMDETAFPILLVDLAARRGCPVELGEYWPMVRRAAAYLVRNGPVTGQDRWEEDGGYSPFTLAAEVAALLVAADLAERCGERGLCGYLRETADLWNEGIDQWTYATGTDLAAEVGVDGYYVRVVTPEAGGAPSPARGWVPIKNRPPGDASEPAAEVVSPDALGLVRFGLRAPGDPRILSTVRAIDHLLRVDTSLGPAWRRYNHDGYGEHADGSPFDGSGIGRPWPLLTGERAHYELAAGNFQTARDLAEAMRRFAGERRLLPEQMWDGPSLPERELEPGGPTGSAMPLVWAHAEYVKLIRSLGEEAVFDCPPQTVARYRDGGRVPAQTIWRWNLRTRRLASGRDLRVEVLEAAVVHWSADGWETVADIPTRDTGLGIHVADLPTRSLEAGAEVVFTFHGADRWEGIDHRVEVR